VNDQRSATLSGKPKAGKEKVVSTRICGETSCNQILARFPLVKSPTKGLNVLYNPFRERTPTKPPARVCFEHDGIHVCLLRRGVFTHSALVAIFREKKGGRYGKPGSSTGKAHRRHARSLWFPTDVFGLFSNNVGPFLRNLVLSGPLFSANVVWKWAMFLGQAIYVLGPLHLKDIFTRIWAGP
jgi:hypothetical protein